MPQRDGVAHAHDRPVADVVSANEDATLIRVRLKAAAAPTVPTPSPKTSPERAPAPLAPAPPVPAPPVPAPPVPAPPVPAPPVPAPAPPAPASKSQRGQHVIKAAQHRDVVEQQREMGETGNLTMTAVESASCLSAEGTTREEGVAEALEKFVLSMHP